MKGWVGLVGWPIADGLPIWVVKHQLQVERRTGKVRRPKTDVLPLSYATNWPTRKVVTGWKWACVHDTVILYELQYLVFRSCTHWISFPVRISSVSGLLGCLLGGNKMQQDLDPTWWRTWMDWYTCMNMPEARSHNICRQTIFGMDAEL